MKDTLSRILAALGILVGLGTLVAFFVVWSMLERRGDSLAGQLKGHEERMTALEDRVFAEKKEDLRPFMPRDYQGTLPPNADLANTTVEYRNAQIGLAFQVPYNPAWGNSEYQVVPFDEFAYLAEPSSVDHVGIFFGGAGPWEGGGWAREYTLYAEPAVSPAQVIETIRKEQADFLEDPAPQIQMVGDKQVVVYYTDGLCSYVRVTVIGEKANYNVSPLCGSDDSIRDRLFDIVRSMEFINE